jgi:2-polyprenyl-3-methyl-5-hydroxy-6-metoxy-1,4-benzoquinol methylase
MTDQPLPKSPLDPNESVSLVATYESEKLITDWKHWFEIDITPELHGVREISLFRCNSTGLQFFAPGSIAGSGLLYKQLQRFDWFYMEDKWEYREALVDLQQCSNVLEIGAAKGAFVRMAIERGINIKGIEINRAAAEDARRHGLPVSCLDMDTIRKTEGQIFDGVCTFQVLEHLADPGAFIDTALSLLKRGGVLILSVPNAESFLRYQYNLLDMPPHHMTRWGEKTFRSLERIHPVKVEKIRFEPLASYHVAGYLNAYRKHFKKTLHPARFMLNGHTLPLFEKILSVALLRRLLTGQTLYAALRKI